MSKEVKNISDVVNITNNIGDKCNAHWEKSGDLKMAQTALGAYKTAIAALKTQVVYKKLTGNPTKIAFLEK